MVKVEAGQATSYHKHHVHDEIVTVISGEGRLMLEDKEVKLKQGVTVSIIREQLHAIIAQTKLRYIEVLMGNVSCDDIERIKFFE